jgi:Putative Flp pilus-assembly TadE/G-like
VTISPQPPSTPSCVETTASPNPSRSPRRWPRLSRFSWSRPWLERGSLTPAVAVFALSALAAAGLAVDGGRKLNGLSLARDLADNAARAGAQEVDVVAYRTSGVPTLDPPAATAAAQAYLSATGHPGTVTVVGDTVTVTVSIHVDSRILPTSPTVSATQSATARSGVSGN